MQSDLDRVRGKLDNGWLNDTILSLWLEELQARFERALSKKCYFVQASESQNLKRMNKNNEIEEALVNKSKGIEFIFFVMGNAKDKEDHLSTHWSLLVYKQSAKTFYVFDSLNRKSAHKD